MRRATSRRLSGEVARMIGTTEPEMMDGPQDKPKSVHAIDTGKERWAGGKNSFDEFDVRVDMRIPVPCLATRAKVG